MEKDKKIQIIGGGTFGLSTAYHLAKSGYKDITVIDREEVPSKFSAGYDLNKIIRCEYPDQFYTGVALEAIERWESAPFKPFFDKVGYVNCVSSNAPKKGLDNIQVLLENLEKHSKFPKNCLEYLNTADEFKSVLPLDIDFEGWTGYFNKHAGYAQALNSMQFLVTECKQMGVKFCVERVKSLLYTSNSECIGVIGVSEKIYRADLTILALGAHVTSVMPEVGKFVTAQSWSVGHIKLREEEAERLKGMPVFNCRNIGFCFEPDKDGNIVKMCNESAGWVNYDPNSAEKYSVPTESNEGVCAVDREALKHQVEAFFPEWKDKEIFDRKICWCCDRSNSDYVIDFHPKYKNLFVATADSGHAFKMLPIFGEWVVQKLNGVMDKEKENRWKWFKDAEARTCDEIETVSWRLGTVLNLHHESRS